MEQMDFHEFKTISTMELTTSVFSMGTILVVGGLMLVDENIIQRVTEKVKSIPMRIGDKILDWWATRQLKNEEDKDDVTQKYIINKVFWVTEDGEKLEDTKYLPRTDIIKTEVHYTHEDQLYKICLYDNEKPVETILDEVTSESRPKRIIFLFGNVNNDDFTEFGGPLQDFHGGVLAKDILQDEHRSELILSVLYRGKEYDFKFERDELVTLTFEENQDAFSTSSTESGVVIRDSRNSTDLE